MDNYIIRIYRRSRRDSREVVGLVEDVAAERTSCFKNVDELLEVIFNPRKRSRTSRGYSNTLHASPDHREGINQTADREE